MDLMISMMTLSSTNWTDVDTETRLDRRERKSSSTAAQLRAAPPPPTRPRSYRAKEQAAVRRADGTTRQLYEVHEAATNVSRCAAIA